MTIFAVVDIESTGLDPANDAIVEIACVDVVDSVLQDKPRSSLIKPPIKIPPESSAVHNITDYDVKNAAAARDVVPIILPLDRDDDVIYVAHNSAFEKSFLEPYIPGAVWICTYKAALRIWPDAPNHKNSTLRYYLNLAVERALADQTHRALPDAYVTAHIFCELLRHSSVEEMVAWTLEPPVMPTCTIGEWRGKPWRDVPEDFLNWMLGKKDMDADLIWNAKRELQRRKDAVAADESHWFKMKRDLYVDTACRVVSLSQSVDDINKWWKDESEHRAVHKIEKGDDAFNAIVAACAKRKQELLASEAIAA